MMSLAELQRRIDAGDLSADAAIAQSLEAIGAHDKTIGAFVCRNEAVGAASAGPLRGIAVGIKDIIDTADFPTQMGSAIYSGWQPRADAAVVMMLKQVGASIVGKTTTTAFASIDPTATLNPRNPQHTPGGSSSGSAAAVAAGMIPLALGTQTGGSVIRPASYCGVAAIKPSFRLLPTVGVKCYSWTLDTVGMFAAGIKDLAHGLSAMTNRPELLPEAATQPPRHTSDNDWPQQVNQNRTGHSEESAQIVPFAKYKLSHSFRHTAWHAGGAIQSGDARMVGPTPKACK